MQESVPSIKKFEMQDTPFVNLMVKRVFNILLIAGKYDAFMLEDDGRVDEKIFNEYASLNLRYPPVSHRSAPKRRPSGRCAKTTTNS